MNTNIELYTDGACLGNPGAGGWAFILRHPTSGKELIQSGGEAKTTNNRMEMLAVIEGLSALKNSAKVVLYSDSKYVLNGIADWMPKWKKNGWKRRPNASESDIKNLDLWKRMDELTLFHSVECVYVPGHSGHPENEHCDRLSVQAAKALKTKNSHF